MRLVIFNNGGKNKEEFERIMEIVKDTGVIVSSGNVLDINNIYLKYKNQIYKFNRYDIIFVNKVELAIIQHPCIHYPGNVYDGPLHICNIDDRFTDTKYYSIERDSKMNETLNIYNNLIVDDLYNEVERLRSVIQSFGNNINTTLEMAKKLTICGK